MSRETRVKKNGKMEEKKSLPKHTFIAELVKPVQHRHAHVPCKLPLTLVASDERPYFNSTYSTAGGNSYLMHYDDSAPGKRLIRRKRIFIVSILRMCVHISASLTHPVHDKHLEATLLSTEQNEAVNRLDSPLVSSQHFTRNRRQSSSTILLLS